MNNTVLEFECIGMDGGSKFPIEYTGRGQDISPEFIIKNLSPNAKTLAVTLEDLSHPIKDFTHWVRAGLPGFLVDWESGSSKRRCCRGT